MVQFFFSQNHTAIGRGLQILSTCKPGMEFPKETLAAYLHFESLVDHGYDSICVSCGSQPKILILDGNRKCAFKMTGKIMLDLHSEYTSRLLMGFHSRILLMPLAFGV
jgi:hypothetical protein